MINPKVAIIILNWNGKEDTIECLDSLKHITYPNYEILLVDNGSTDGSVECFSERYHSMEIIENGKNLGFAEGNNVGIRKAMEKGVDYVLLLNNDTVVDPEFLGELVKVGESDKRIGILGPKTYYYSQPNKIQFTWNKIDFFRGKIFLAGSGDIDRGQNNEIHKTDYVPGSCFLAKREVIKEVGMLDNKYFCYWEETDYCMRTKREGYQCVYCPKAKIWHKISQCANKITGFSTYYRTRNMFWFMKQHATKKQYLSFLLYFFVFRFWFSSGMHILYHKNINVFISFFRGVLDGIKTVR